MYDNSTNKQIIWAISIVIIIVSFMYFAMNRFVPGSEHIIIDKMMGEAWVIGVDEAGNRKLFKHSR